jgi:hypothetical protein
MLDDHRGVCNQGLDLFTFVADDSDHISRTCLPGCIDHPTHQRLAKYLMGYLRPGALHPCPRPCCQNQSIKGRHLLHIAPVLENTGKLDFTLLAMSYHSNYGILSGFSGKAGLVFL